MGTNRWDANAFHRRHSGRGTTMGPMANRGRKVLAGSLLAVLIVASGAVALAHQAATDAPADAHCHPTGSDTNPAVAIEGGNAADAPGHADEADFQAADEGCDEASVAAGACPHTAAPVAEEEAPADPAAETADGAADVCLGDASLNVLTTLDNAWFHQDIAVASLGPIHVRDVVVSEELPDVGGRWEIDDGSDEGCTLQGRLLACDFGDIPVDETREVSLTSARCTLECDESALAETVLQAANDANDGNNVVESVFEAPGCAPVDDATPDDDGNATTEDNATADDDPAPDDDADADGNATTDDNATADDNATPDDEVPVEDPNASSPNDSAPAPAGDVRALSRAAQDDDDVTLTFVVRNVGSGEAVNVLLDDELPDVRRTWFLGGVDATDCTLTARELRCVFGDLDAGAERTVFVKAYTDRIPCGQHLVNTATATSSGDANTANDRSSSSIEARGC